MTVGISQALRSHPSKSFAARIPAPFFSMRVRSKSPDWTSTPCAPSVDRGWYDDSFPSPPSPADGGSVHIPPIPPPAPSPFDVTGHPGDTLSGIAAAHGGQLAELARQIEREGYEPIIGPVAAEAGASRTSLTGVVAEAQA